MSGRDVIEIEEIEVAKAEPNSELLRLLKEGTVGNARQSVRKVGVVIGELIGITGEGRVPLVLYPGQTGTAAIVAQTVIDLHGPHIGKKVVLMFEGGDGTAQACFDLRVQRPFVRNSAHQLGVVARQELSQFCLERPHFRHGYVVEEALVQGEHHCDFF